MQGLDTIKSEIDSGQFDFKTELEDIHLNIEKRLTDKIGEAGRAFTQLVHAMIKSRLDFKLYVRNRIDALDAKLAALQLALARKAFVYNGAIMPGFTHLQIAQPVSLGHHLMAYVEMFARDRGSVKDARKRLNECPFRRSRSCRNIFPD